MFFLTCAISNSYSHGDLHARIKAVSKEIKKSPDSAALYMKRGELYLQHEEFKRSLKDFNKCKNLGLDNTKLSYNLAVNYLRLRKYSKSLEVVNVIITDIPDHVKAYRLQGEVNLRQGHYLSAGKSFEKVIAYASETIPENFLEASYAYQMDNKKESRCKAVEILVQGTDELGPLNIFYDQLIILAEAEGEYESILYYQSKQIELANRKEWMLYERSLTYQKMGRVDKATDDLYSAKSAIESLKPRLQNQSATKNLNHKILNELSSLTLKSSNKKI